MYVEKDVPINWNTSTVISTIGKLITQVNLLNTVNLLKNEINFYLLCYKLLFCLLPNNPLEINRLSISNHIL